MSQHWLLQQTMGVGLNSWHTPVLVWWLPEPHLRDSGSHLDNRDTFILKGFFLHFQSSSQFCFPVHFPPPFFSLSALPPNKRIWSKNTRSSLSKDLSVLLPWISFIVEFIFFSSRGRLAFAITWGENNHYHTSKLKVGFDKGMPELRKVLIVAQFLENLCTGCTWLLLKHWVQ